LLFHHKQQKPTKQTKRKKYYTSSQSTIFPDQKGKRHTNKKKALFYVPFRKVAAEERKKENANNYSSTCFPWSRGMWRRGNRNLEWVLAAPKAIIIGIRKSLLVFVNGDQKNATTNMQGRVVRYASVTAYDEKKKISKTLFFICLFIYKLWSKGNLWGPGILEFWTILGRERFSDSGFVLL
jgi:hypothetical protein